MKMGRVKRLTEDSFDGTAYIKLCGTSFPYDGEYCASDECPVLNEIMNLDEEGEKKSK